MPLKQPTWSSTALRRICALGLLVVWVVTGPSAAQNALPGQAPVGKTIAPGAQTGPAWAALKPQQRQALAPLAATWDSLSPGQQRKWLEVSRSYGTLPPADQAKMHGRMAEWVRLSARERSAARLNFGATTEIAKELSPQEKKDRWDAYQALSADERKKLAAQAGKPTAGAAPAARPVASQKLVILPAPAENAAASSANPATAAATAGTATPRSTP